jgi:class I fructose-bisphosphate aldolase
MQGKSIRLAKICGQDNRAMLVAADHGLMLGAIGGVIDLEASLTKIIKGGCDGILISPGQASHISHLFYGKKAPAMLIRGDYTSGFRTLTYTLPNQQIQEFKIIPPKKALAMGADAMVVYYLIGRPDDPFDDEATNIKIISQMAEESEAVGLPFFIEPMPFGPRVTGTNYIDLLKIGIRVAEEIGADAIKIPYSGDISSFRDIVKSVDIPIFILGGAKSSSYREGCELVEEAIKAGANGTVFGRQILQAPDPEQLARYLMKIVHENISTKELFARKITKPSRLQIDMNKCTGCCICSIACALSHSGTNHPNYYAIHVEKEFPKKLSPHVCIHCKKCVTACPESAILVDENDSHLKIDASKCNLCVNSGINDPSELKCVEICPTRVIKPPIYAPNPSNSQNITQYPQNIPLICDFCGGYPECVEWCPNEAVVIKEKQGGSEE